MRPVRIGVALTNSYQSIYKVPMGYTARLMMSQAANVHVEDEVGVSIRVNDEHHCRETPIEAGGFKSSVVGKDTLNGGDEVFAKGENVELTLTFQEHLVIPDDLSEFRSILAAQPLLGEFSFLSVFGVGYAVGNSGGLTTPLTFRGQYELYGRATPAYGEVLGGLKEFGIDEPRIEYDAITGERHGLLIERQESNSIFSPLPTDNAPNWTTSEITEESYFNEPVLGGAVVSRFVVSDVNDEHYIQRKCVHGVGKFKISAIAKQDGAYSKVRIRALHIGSDTRKKDGSVGASGTTAFGYDIATETVYVENDGVLDYEVKNLGNDYYKISMIYEIVNHAGDNDAFRLHIDDQDVSDYAGDGTSAVLVALPMVSDEGFFSSSVVAQQTRAADSLIVENIDQTDWFNPNEGTIFFEFQLNGLDRNASLLTLLKDNDNFLEFWIAASSMSLMVRGYENGSQILYDAFPGTIESDQVRKIAASYDGISLKFIQDGQNIKTQGYGLGFIPNQLKISDQRRGTYPINVNLKSFAFSRRSVSDVEMQQLVSG